MSYGSNPYRKDNPRWTISNATETPEVPGGVAAWARTTWGRCVSWAIGLPRRTGRRLHAGSDAEARWWRWDVTERRAGLGRQYRDARFAVLRPGLAFGRGELAADLAGGAQGKR